MGHKRFKRHKRNFDPSMLENRRRYLRQMARGLRIVFMRHLKTSLEDNIHARLREVNVVRSFTAAVT